MSAISNPLEFREAAQFQRVCAVCNSPGRFESHHVVSKQRLKRLGLVHRLYDPRNALRLCPTCHGRQEGKALHISTEMLTRENICFMWEALGVAGRNYLERHYTGVERRFTLHEDKKCPLCQLQRHP